MPGQVHRIETGDEWFRDYGPIFVTDARGRVAYTKWIYNAYGKGEEYADLLNKTVLTIGQQAGDDGRLFGSVTNQDIADAIREARDVRIDKRKVHLEDPIKHIGTYMVVVEVADGATATVKTIVTER